MKRLGIRLIGALFVIAAIVDLIELIMGTHSPSGFLGITVRIGYPVDIMGWIGVYFLGYVGYHLLKLHSEGHTWALVILGVYALYSGVYFILTIILSIASPAEFHITANFLNKSFKTDTSIATFLATGALFLFNTAQIYFLMRKDVKIEFQRTEEAKESP